MNLRHSFFQIALLGVLLATAGSTNGEPTPPTVVPAQPPSSPPVSVASPEVKALVESSPVSAPPVAYTGPLPTGVFAWDSENKSIDARQGDDKGHLFFDFTNVSPADVVISNVHPGCGCTTVQFPTPDTVPAGTSGRINVSIDLRGKMGTLFKNLTVTTDKGIKVLNFRVNILPFVQPKLTDEARSNMLAMAKADRQAIFKPECAECHVRQGEGKYGQFLYNADCGICHDGEHRASMVPDLHAIKVPTNVDFWRTWITNGKPGSLMPAFSKREGGPLSDMQIATLAQYLNHIIPSKPAPSP